MHRLILVTTCSFLRVNAVLALFGLALFGPLLLGPAMLVHAESPPDITNLLARPILAPGTPLSEVQKFIEPRIPPMPVPESLEEWQPIAKQIRQDMLHRVVFRGAAAQWGQAELNVEWLENLAGGPGYKIRKLRYESAPGLWIPALLYLPDQLSGHVPVVMNVNGHDPNGKWVDYKQIRCINQVKRGMIVLNPEWLGMGQLASETYRHTRMNQIDLCGSSGLAPFYLSLQRGLDLLLSLEHADPERVAVAGLSGGGWQTIFISALDPRVTLSNPVAGYSSFLTRLYEPKDLGDSEQTPCDMATVADYCHLTALRAPRPTLLTNNAQDNCCFEAAGTLPRLLQAAGPIYKLYHQQANLRSHVNYLPGNHNFELDNRLQLYRMLGEHFYAAEPQYEYEEIPCTDELKTKAECHVELPKSNANFNTLASDLAKHLPRHRELPTDRDQVDSWQSTQRKILQKLIHANKSEITAKKITESNADPTQVTYWQIQVGKTWSVPAVELTRGIPHTTTILLADGGRDQAAVEVEKLLTAGGRVVAIDPFYLGESKFPARDYLYALLVACVGERPLGIQVTQVAAISRWAKEQFRTDSIGLLTSGPRTSLIGLIAAAVEPEAVGQLKLQGSLGSLKEIIENNMQVSKAPELFCFGLLEQFDIPQIAALVAPRPITFAQPNSRVKQELANLAAFYQLLGSAHQPLP